MNLKLKLLKNRCLVFKNWNWNCSKINSFC